MSDSERFIRAFRRWSWLGIDCPTRAFAFVTVLGLSIVLVFIIEVFFPWEALLRNVDFKSKNKVSIARLAKDLDEAATGPDSKVLLIGGSTARELSPANSYVSSKVSISCDRPVRFINAGTSSQSLAESWAIIDAIGAQNLDVVIVGFNYYRLITTKTILEQQAGRVDIVPVPPSSSLQLAYLRDFQKFPSLRLVGMLGVVKSLGGFGRANANTYPHDQERPFFGARNYYRGPPKDSEWKKARVAQLAATRGPGYLTVARQGTELWLDFSNFLLGKGVTVVFLALPYDPSMEPIEHLMGPQFEAALGQLRKAGAAVVDWRKGLELSAADFYDQQHLLEEGRKKIANKLVRVVAGHLPECRSLAR